MGLLVLVVLGGAGWYGYDWWRGHRPVERPLVVERVVGVEMRTVGAPSEVVRNGERVLNERPVRLMFGESAAPLEQVGHEVGDGLAWDPPVPGKWKWESQSELVFTPERDWPAGTSYRLRMAPRVLGTGVRPAVAEWEMVTPAQEVVLKRWELVSSEQDPTLHELVGEVHTSYPTSADDLREHLQLEVVNGAEVLKVAAGKPAISLTRAENSLNVWYLRSVPVTIPARPEYVRLALRRGLGTTSGGAESASEFAEQALVPDRKSGLQFEESSAQITLDDEGEPHQVLLVRANQVLRAADLAGKVTAWLLSEADWRSIDNGAKPNEGMLARAKPVALEQDENLAPLSRIYGFRFLVEKGGRMLVRIAPGVECPAGFEIPDGKFDVVDVPSFPRCLEVTGKGNVLALQGEKKLQIKSRGVEAIRLTLGRVRPADIQHLITQNDYGDFSLPQFNYSFPEDSLVRRQEIILQTQMRNEYQANFTEFDFAEAIKGLDPADPDPSRGLFFVSVAEYVKPEPREKPTGVHAQSEPPYDSYDQDRDEEADRGGDSSGDSELGQRRFIMLTDLGLIEKRHADGSRDVFVQRVAAGGPQAGAVVAVLARNGEVLASGVTDAQGRVALPSTNGSHRERAAVAITARLGNDFSYLPLRRGQLAQLDFSRYNTDGLLASRIKATEAFVFSERGIYRPGDTVHVGAVVRRRDWAPVLEGLPLRMRMIDVKGNEVGSEDFSLAADGLWAGEFATDENMPTGVCRLELQVLSAGADPQELYTLGEHTVRVEEFQPDRMKLAVAFDPAPAAGWAKPEELKLQYELRSLFGTAEAGNRVTTKLELRPAAFRFDGWADYTFHDRGAESSQSTAGQSEDLGEVATDAEGKASVPLDLAKYKDASFQLGILAEAFESDGGRSVREVRSLLVSPWDEILGYKADGDLDFIGKDSRRSVKLIALDRAAKPVAVANLKLRLTEQRSVSVLTRRDDGTYAYQSVERTQQLDEQPLELATEPRVLELPTARAGTFNYELVNPAGQVVCVVPFHVVGKGDENRSLERDSELVMRLAKTSVAPGEELELEIVAPYRGSGLVTLERERVLASQWFSMPEGGGTVRLKVPADLEGTVYVNATVVRALDSPDVFMSPLSYAVKPLRVEPVRRKLAVQLDVPEKVLPGTDLVVGVSAKQRSRVVVFAVDEGIHQVTRYRRPEPLDFFFRKQALEVSTLQWFDLLMPELRFLRNHAAFGGDADGALSQFLNPFKRKREAPVVWWSGIVEAGPERSELRWQVPDYFAGGLNVMAVAVNAEAVGADAKHLIVRAPLVLNANAPTFVAPADEFTVSLGVTNVFDDGAEAEVTIAAEGEGPVELLDSPEQTVKVAAGQEAHVRVRCRGGKELGGATVKFTATARGVQLSREVTMSVRPPGPRITSVQSGYFRLAKHEVATPRSLYEEFRRTKATVSVTPVAAAAGLLEYVGGYPHGCSEQITSKAFAKLAVGAREEFGQTEAQVAESTSIAVRELGARQSVDGWFSYWNGGGRAEEMDFVTLWAMHFLLEAREKGHPVDKEMFERGNRALGRMAGQVAATGEDAWLRAYAIYLRTRAGEVTTSDLLSLRDVLESKQKDTWRNDVAGMLVASTYQLLKKEDEADRLAKGFLKGTQHFATLGSGRTLSYWAQSDVKRLLAFALCCRHFPELVKDFGIDDWNNVLRCVWEERFNTLTAAYACVGLSEFSNKVAGGSQLRVGELDKDKQYSALETRGTLVQSAEFSSAAKALRFEMEDGKGADLGAFYQVTQVGFDIEPPHDEVKDGIEVVRTLTDADGKPLGKLKVGESVKVTLSVRGLQGKDIPSVAMLDLLPGGFEVEKDELVPGQHGGLRVDVREDRNVFYLNLHGGEVQTISYRVKPVCAGRFVVPPVYAESMYDRGLTGRGPAAEVVVEARD